MKHFGKIFLTLAFAVASIWGSAQKNNVTNAIMAFKDFSKLMQSNPTGARGKLLDAKKYIDLAAEHAETKEDPKMYYYKGQIYMAAAQFAAMKADGFADLNAENTMTTAFDCFKQSIARKNKKDDFSDQIRMTLAPAHGQTYKMGIEMYQRNSYDSAQAMFESCVLLMDVISSLDTNALSNAGLCAELQGQQAETKCLESGDTVCADAKKHYEEAANHYKKMAASGYQGADSYVRYSTVLQKTGNLKEAEAAIQEGKAKYPNSNSLTIQEFNIYLMAGDNASAEKALSEAIKNNPNDPMLYFNAGAIYSDLEKYDQAEASYKKAIEIQPKYFDAYFNLGAMFYNRAADMYKVINDIKDNALYEKEKTKADDLFKSALPWLEKAKELNPNDRNNLIMLRTIYARLSMNDKWKEVNDKLKNG